MDHLRFVDPQMKPQRTSPARAERAPGRASTEQGGGRPAAGASSAHRRFTQTSVRAEDGRVRGSPYSATTTVAPAPVVTLRPVVLAGMVRAAV